MKLLTTAEYIQDATQEIDQASSRVIVMTLCIENEKRTETFMTSLLGSVKRGLDVNVAADLFTFSELGGSFSPFKRLTRRSQMAALFAKKLKKVGADFTWLGGNHKFNPFAGVTHIKWTVVDDIVYIFGGVNLYGKGVTRNDYMFKVNDKKLADMVVSEQNAIIKADTGPGKYVGFQADISQGNLMIDSGRPGYSLIYSRACELAQKAESIVFVSQYCPTGKLASIIRSKKSKIYFNQPNKTQFETHIMLRASQWLTGLHSLYKRSNYLHAKFIIFTMTDGSKVALTGSHNFNYSGVRLGTREVELETQELKIISQLEEFYKDFVD